MYLLVGLSAGLHKKHCTDFHRTWMIDGQIDIWIKGLIFTSLSLTLRVPSTEALANAVFQTTSPFPQWSCWRKTVVAVSGCPKIFAHFLSEHVVLRVWISIMLQVTWNTVLCVLVASFSVVRLTYFAKKMKTQVESQTYKQICVMWTCAHVIMFPFVSLYVLHVFYVDVWVCVCF